MMSLRSLLDAQFFSTGLAACSRSMIDFCASHCETATAWRMTLTGTFSERSLRISSLPSRTVLPVTPAPTRLRTVAKTTVSPFFLVKSVCSWIMEFMLVPKYGANWFSRMYSVQNVSCQMIGVRPGLAGVAIMSAIGWVPHWSCGPLQRPGLRSRHPLRRPGDGRDTRGIHPVTVRITLTA